MKKLQQGEDSIKKLLYKWSKKVNGKIKGCTLKELEEIKNRQRVNFLPKIYEEFMRSLGRESGGLEWIYGFEFRYPFVLEYKEKSIPAILKVLPTDIFVFWTDYENALYFRTLEKPEDPSIFHVTSSELNRENYLISEMGKLSKFFADVIDSNL